MTEHIPYNELTFIDKMVISMVEEDSTEGIPLVAIVSTAAGGTVWAGVELAEAASAEHTQKVTTIVKSATPQAEQQTGSYDGLLAGVLVGAACYALVKRRYKQIAPKIDPESR